MNELDKKLDEKLKKWKHNLIISAWFSIQIIGIILLAMGFQIIHDHIYRFMLVVAYVFQFAICLGLLVEKISKEVPRSE